MKFKDISVNILFLVAGALLTYFITKQISIENEETRYFDLKVNQKSFIIKPTNIDKNLEIFLGGEKINNLSQVTIELFNFTDKNYSKIPIYIKLKSSDGDTLKIIQTEVFGENNLPDKIKENKNIISSDDKTSFKVGYTISNANQSNNSLEPIFTGHYYFIGNAEVQSDLDIDFKGLKIRSFSYENAFPKSWYNEPWIILLFTTIVYFALIIITFRISTKLRRKKLVKDTELQLNFISENIDVSAIEIDKPESLMILLKEIDYLSEKWYWGKMSYLRKLVYGYEEPIKS